MSEVKRANEGGKREFLRVRRVRDLDTLPQKERKTRLKQSISRRRRAKPRRDKAFSWTESRLRMAGLSLKKQKIERRKKHKAFSPSSSRFFAYLICGARACERSVRKNPKDSQTSFGFLNQRISPPLNLCKVVVDIKGTPRHLIGGGIDEEGHALFLGGVRERDAGRPERQAVLKGLRVAAVASVAE